jgi:hypothetical protein
MVVVKSMVFGEMEIGETSEGELSESCFTGSRLIHDFFVRLG